MGDFIDERESGLRFGEDESCGNFTLFNVADNGSNLIRMLRVAGKLVVDVRRRKNIERDDGARRQVVIFFSLELDGEVSICKEVFFNFGKLPSELCGQPSLEIERLDFGVAEKRSFVSVVGDGDRFSFFQGFESFQRIKSGREKVAPAF